MPCLITLNCQKGDATLLSTLHTPPLTPLINREADIFGYGGGRLTFHVVCWNAHGEVYVGCKEGRLLRFSAESEEGVVVDADSHNGQGITGVMLTARHLITSCKVVSCFRVLVSFIYCRMEISASSILAPTNLSSP